MTTMTDEFVAGGRLPDVTLSGVGGMEGRSIPLRRAGREATFLFVAHGPDCDACRDYMLRLRDAQLAELRHWYARVVVVGGDVAAANDAPAAADAARAGFITAEDATGATAGAAEDGQVALVVANRFGRIFDVARADDADGLPALSEIEEWARFLSMQCPECGVPDDPGRGPWGA